MTQYRSYKKPEVPFGIMVSGGSIPGWSYVHKFGRNPACAADTKEIIWDGSRGTYEWPDSACTLSIQSTSACDVATTGAGAQTVKIYGHNASRSEISETVSLNGTTTVNSACAYSRVFRMEVTQAGSDMHNHGIISACANSYGLAYISASYNQTLMALYSIPDDREGFLVDWYGSVNISSKIAAEREADLTLWIRGASSNNAFQIKDFIGLNSNGAGHAEIDFNPNRYLAPGTDLYISACAQDADTDISAGFDIYLHDIT